MYADDFFCRRDRGRKLRSSRRLSPQVICLYTYVYIYIDLNLYPCNFPRGSKYKYNEHSVPTWGSMSMVSGIMVMAPGIMIAVWARYSLLR